MKNDQIKIQGKNKIENNKIIQITNFSLKEKNADLKEYKNTD
jgi:hypothetical protein